MDINLIFSSRAEHRGGVYVADVPTRDETGHSDAGRHAGRRHLPTGHEKFPP